MTNPIRPCPFCGKRVIAFRSDLPPTDYCWTLRHDVGGCVWYFSLAFKTKAEAITAWNQRAPAKMLATDLLSEVHQLEDIADAYLHGEERDAVNGTAYRIRKIARALHD